MQSLTSSKSGQCLKHSSLRLLAPPAGLRSSRSLRSSLINPSKLYTNLPVSRGATTAASSSPGPQQSNSDEVWTIAWCYDGWFQIYDWLEQMLPSERFKLQRFDTSRPLHEQVAEAKVLIPTTGTVSAEAIHAARDLRLIAQPAAGYNNIAIQAAKERGVPVTLAPGYNSQPTAEIALCMMLMLARRVDEARDMFRDRQIGKPAGNQLWGKTLGIVGMGLVGKALATAAGALGMRVIHTTSNSSRPELEALLAASDVVSLHVPLNAKTEGMLGSKELALMKPGALLINTARGSVVQKQALLEALESGHLGGVGLDVHWQEPPEDPVNDPLYRHPRVIALPHVGTASQEWYKTVAGVLCENILRVRDGRQSLLHQLEL